MRVGSICVVRFYEFDRANVANQALPELKYDGGVHMELIVGTRPISKPAVGRSFRRNSGQAALRPGSQVVGAVGWAVGPLEMAIAWVILGGSPLRNASPAGFSRLAPRCQAILRRFR